MSTPTDADNGRPQPSRRFGAGALAGAAAAALVVGAAAGLAAGTLIDGSGDLTAQDDLDTMCRYVESIDTPVELTDGYVMTPPAYRIMAAAELAVAAGYGQDDDTLRLLGVDLLEGSRRLQEDLMTEGLEGLVKYCD